jgi:isoleucyl-tRNA synthetase
MDWGIEFYDIKGEELVGKSYEPLFGDRGKNAQKIWSADFVTTDSGTGIVHILHQPTVKMTLF